MKTLPLWAVCLATVSLFACAAPPETPAETVVAEAPTDPCIDPAPDYPVDLCVNMIEPDAGPAPEEEPAVRLEPCPDEGPRLPISNVCKGRSVNFMNMDDLAIEAPAGCDWETHELELLNEALLYRSLTCGETETRLALEIGAQTASLTFASSALGHELGTEAARMFGGNEDYNPELYLSSVLEASQKETCRIITPNIEGWPSDARVIGIPATGERPVAEGACGPYGYLEDATAFWRIIDDYALYFDFGQDAHAIDAASFVVIPVK